MAIELCIFIIILQGSAWFTPPSGTDENANAGIPVIHRH
jgi:hypothetical protein